MEHTFEQLVREFRHLVAFQLSGKSETMTIVEKKEIRIQIGNLIDAIATMVVGIPCRGMDKLSMDEVVAFMSHVRKDVYDKLSDIGIGYSQYVRDGTIAVQLLDKDSGVCIYRGVTDTYNEDALRHSMKDNPMERASVH